jgi:rhodanese-related sulfurtransferase
MKYLRNYFTALLAVLVLLSLFSCSKDSTEPEEKPINEFNVLVQYLEGTGGDYINTTAPKIVTAGTVAPNLADYKVIDIRQEADYNAKHIDGAVNVSLANIKTYAETNLGKTDKILVACYSGQSAGHAVLALNLLGYDAYSLKWGMTCADTSLDRWTSGTSSAYASSFTTTPTALNAAGEYPTLSTGKKTGEEILAARVDAMLAAGYKSKSATDVLANPSNYYIVNYFSESDYIGQGNCPPGHIDGAYQYTPNSSLKTTAQLKNLPTDKPIVVYCWTGQNSSQVAAFLNVLGYDAYSLGRGVNGMVYDQLLPGGTKWSASQITSVLPLVP